MGQIGYVPRESFRTPNTRLKPNQIKQIVGYSTIVGALDHYNSGTDYPLYTIPENSTLYVTFFCMNAQTAPCVVSLSDSATGKISTIAELGQFIPAELVQPLKFENNMTLRVSSSQDFYLVWNGYLVTYSAGDYINFPQELTEY